MKNALLLLAALVVSGCATGQPAPDPAALVTLEKGGCGYIAACPAYFISMKPDGSYHYEGFRNVAVLGVRDGQLPAGAWDEAEAAFAAAGWTTLEDPTKRKGGYPCMSDSPFAKITRRVQAGEEKVFHFNLGCDSEGGLALLTALGGILPMPAP